MEAERSHGLLSASGRSRKAGGLVLVQTQRPKIMDVPGQEKAHIPAQTREQIPLSAVCLLYSVPQKIGWCPPTGGWVQVLFLTQSTDSNPNLFWKCSHRHTQKQCFTSHLGIPKPSQVDTKLTITAVVRGVGAGVKGRRCCGCLRQEGHSPPGGLGERIRGKQEPS